MCVEIRIVPVRRMRAFSFRWLAIRRSGAGTTPPQTPEGGPREVVWARASSARSSAKWTAATIA